MGEQQLENDPGPDTKIWKTDVL